MPVGTGTLRLARRLVALALRSWPRDVRRRDGASLMAALEEEMKAAEARGHLALLRSLLGELVSVLRTGATLRVGRTIRGGGALSRGRVRPGSGWWDDARVAGRTLTRTPGFALVAVGTLALGIGANAAVFDLAERIVLRPPAYAQPDELVLVWSTLGTSGDRIPVSAPDAAVVAERAAALAAVAFTGRSTDGTLAARAEDMPQHVVVAGVTPNYFDLLGVDVARGRSFRDEDAAPAPTAAADGTTPPAVLVSDAAWRRVFAADSALPGRTVLLNGRPVIVLGVVPPGFRLELPPSAGIGTDVDVWVPLRVPLSAFVRADGRLIDRDSDNGGAVVGRLAPGATVERAGEQLARIASELRAEVPGYAAAGFGLEARPLHADATAHARELLGALLAGAAGLFLIACLSLSALLLARGMARERELAVREALGASRERLARALLAESLLLLVAGAAAAYPVALACARALEGLAPAELMIFARAPGVPPIGFMLAASAGTALLLALIAALQVGLPRGGPGGAARLLRTRFGRARARRALVVAEVAVSVVLVLGAGLLLRTAAALGDVRVGFAAEGALAFDVSVRVAGAYTGPAQRAELVRTLERAALEVPGVRAVGLTGALPLSGRRWTQPYGLPGESPDEWTARRADFRSVTSGYFDAIGTRVLEGRSFTRAEDLDERERVVVVDETLARRISPAGSALGRTLAIPLDGSAVEARVVGVVERVRHEDLDRPGREAIYVPYRQEASRDVSFVVRTAGDPGEAAASVRRALLEVEPRLAIYGMRAMTGYVDAEIAPTRFGLLLLTVYAGLGLLSAALGLYGVVAWEVGRRTHDLGVRMAVGATAAQLRAGVLADGLKLAALGALLGVALAALAAGALRRFVYGVGIADPATWLGVLGLVGAVTLLACWVPAARASRLDPTVALRSD